MDQGSSQRSGERRRWVLGKRGRLSPEPPVEWTHGAKKTQTQGDAKLSAGQRGLKEGERDPETGAVSNALI